MSNGDVGGSLSMGCSGEGRRLRIERALGLEGWPEEGAGPDFQGLRRDNGLRSRGAEGLTVRDKAQAEQISPSIALGGQAARTSG